MRVRHPCYAPSRHRTHLPLEPRQAEDRDLLLFLPIIRADYHLLATYVFNPNRDLLKIPISVWVGSHDDIEFSDALEWQLHTEASCDVVSFDGGHFFIHDHSSLICSKFNKILS